jgi:peroxiredoxin Q/BCP
VKKALRVMTLPVTVVAGLLSAKPARAQELKPGDPAPDFNLAGTDGKQYSLAGLKGRAVVLAWFPKAFTAG